MGFLALPERRAIPVQVAATGASPDCWTSPDMRGGDDALRRLYDRQQVAPRSADAVSALYGGLVLLTDGVAVEGI